MSRVVRVSEWSRVLGHGISAEERRDLETAVEQWRVLNGLNQAPIFFAGAEGNQLCARQYVGVIEVGDVSLEIYPKLDSNLIQMDEESLLSDSGLIDSVMRHLMWIIQVAEHNDVLELATAHLEERLTSFFDLFAYLLGIHLLPELEQGIAHRYVPQEDDLSAVRGRIGFVRQVAANWNRADRIYCAWDDFTPNIALNRLFKCACRTLSERVSHKEAARLLKDGQTLLNDVADVSVVTALNDVTNLRFDRSMERFRVVYELAYRLLAGFAQDLCTGSANTFVFLLDMNQLFEDYVRAVLEAYFKTGVETQKFVGRLFSLQAGGIFQKADYYWHQGSTVWIGDAKYKHLAKGQHAALEFSQLELEEDEMEPDGPSAGRILSPNDVRQLTVYAELVKSRHGLPGPPQLVLLYPFVGDLTECVPDCCEAWNGSSFWLMPVFVKPLNWVGEAISFVHAKISS